MIHPPIRRIVTVATLGATLGAVLLGGGCARTPTGGQASAAQQAACQQRANEVYAKQNRDEVYRNDTYVSTTRDSPFSTSGLPGITTRGLGGQYARDNMVSDCLNDVAGNVGDSGASTADAPQPTGAAQTPGRLPRSLSPLAVPPTSR